MEWGQRGYVTSATGREKFWHYLNNGNVGPTFCPMGCSLIEDPGSWSAPVTLLPSETLLLQLLRSGLVVPLRLWDPLVVAVVLCHPAPLVPCFGIEAEFQAL